MRLVIDRITNDIVVVETEDGKTFEIPIGIIPEGAKEGQVLSVTIDLEHTQKLKDEIDTLMDELWLD